MELRCSAGNILEMADDTVPHSLEHEVRSTPGFVQGDR
jgi:hypothetical protein